MKKIIVLIAVLITSATVLSAQITRKQSDTIVKEYLQSKNVDCNLLYVNVNEPNAEGIVISTSNDETFRAKYACWAYYLNKSEMQQCHYLFVKMDDGNLLEVIASNDFEQNDLTQWKTLVDSVGMVEGEKNILTLYPNPTNGQLKIENVELKISTIEIYDAVGRLLHSKIINLQSETVLDISHLPVGVYLLSVYDETKRIYKVVKQ